MTQALSAAVAHVAAHELGAAAYAIKAARAAAPKGEGDRIGRRERRWQRKRLPEAIRDLVLDDQRLRNGICWSAFDCSVGRRLAPAAQQAHQPPLLLLEIAALLVLPVLPHG